MTTEKRPTLRPRVTPKTEANRQAELDKGVRLTIEGEVYEVRIGDVTSRLAREFRAATGHGVYALVSAVTVEPDVDLIAEIVWLARRLRGEDVELDDVEVSYAQLLADGFDVDVPGEEKDLGSPEG